MSTTSNSRISVILPCRNEEEAIADILSKLDRVIFENRLDAEIILVDNASTDKSTEILKQSRIKYPKLTVIREERVGYGSACLRGLSAVSADRDCIVIADCDDTYDLSDISKFIKELRNGSDLVVGNRFTGLMAKGAMPWLHRYIGNPILSLLVRLFFKVSIGDIHCGMRAMTRYAKDTLPLNTTGMEFASEMIIKAAKRNLHISEIPISYSVRIGSSKLKSFSDGWRHLRFILLYSPLVLFFIPGIVLFSLGLISLLVLYFASPTLFGLTFYIHPMFLSAVGVIAGYQLMLFAAFARTYAITHLGDHDGFFEPLYRLITIERAGIIGITLSLIGAAIYAQIFAKWISSGFGPLDEIKSATVALTLTVIGIQTFFSAFMLSILGIKDR